MSAKAKLKYVLFGAVFAGGFASLSLELAVMRQLSGFVGSTAVTASIIIGVLLAFMSLGYYRGSTVSIRRNRIRQVLAPDFIVIALMSVLASSYILIDLYFWAMNGLGIRSNVAQTFVYSLLLLSAAPYLFGKVTAVLSRYLHRFDRNNTGRIMAVDTVGSVLGSILTTLVLMPFVGVNHTVMLIAAAALLTAWLLGSRQIVLMLFIMLAAFSLNRDRLLFEVDDFGGRSRRRPFENNDDERRRRFESVGRSGTSFRLRALCRGQFHLPAAANRYAEEDTHYRRRRLYHGAE